MRQNDVISREALLKAFGFSEATRKYGGDGSGYDTLLKYEIQMMIENAPELSCEGCDFENSRLFDGALAVCDYCKRGAPDRYISKKKTQ